MVWPLYIASAITLLSQTLPTKKDEKVIAPSSGSLFYSGILTGLSLGYLIAAEFQRRRIWDYWRLQWRQRVFKQKEPKNSNLDGITVEHVVSPRDHRTSHLHVDILTIPPRRQLTGRSQGVECYVVLRGSLVVNDVEVKTQHVLEPFVDRTLVNPSSTMSSVVYRTADSASKDTSVEKEETIVESMTNYLSSAMESLPSFSRAGRTETKS